MSPRGFGIRSKDEKDYWLFLRKVARRLCGKRIIPFRQGGGVVSGGGEKEGKG